MNSCNTCQVGNGAEALSIDDLAAATGTTTRHIRSLQTWGLLPRPALRGRTGVYDAGHRERVDAVLRLQRQGFSLESLVLLFGALESGRTLASVLGVLPSISMAADGEGGTDAADLYGFAELQPARAQPRGRPVLSVVPTTVWDEHQAS
jgi:DNA-binding transcriptional MerR regulator